MIQLITELKKVVLEKRFVVVNVQLQFENAKISLEYMRGSSQTS